MNENIIAALVASTVSLFVAMLSLMGNWLSNRASRQRLYQEIKSDFAHFLYKERLESFSEAFKITGRIRRKKSPQYLESHELLNKIAEDLIEWSSGKGGLLMTSTAIGASRSLIDALRKSPAYRENYSREQMEKIWQLRSEFRKSLREGIIHLSPSAQLRSTLGLDR